MQHAQALCLARWQYRMKYDGDCFDTNLKYNLAVWQPVWGCWQCGQGCRSVIWISSVGSNEKASSTASTWCSFRYFILCVLFQPWWCLVSMSCQSILYTTVYCVQIQAPPPHAHACSYVSAHTHTCTNRLCNLYINQSSFWYGTRTGPLAVQAAAAHLEVNVNIMANKIIPFP